MNFKQLGIDESILRALNEIGYTNPTPVQQKAIAPIKSGRDLLCCAGKDAGKTTAFAVPMLEKMGKPQFNEDRPIKSLILAPNRELAMQIYGNICQCGRYTGRIAAVIYSGASQIPQIEAIKRGADILVSTPMRLIEFLEKNLVNLDKIECFVVSDADKMFERGFLNDIKTIKYKLPKKHQTLLFTEVLTSQIRELSNKILYRPFRIDTTIKKRHTAITTTKTNVRRKEQREKRTEKSVHMQRKNSKNVLTSAITTENIQKLTVRRPSVKRPERVKTPNIKSQKTTHIRDEFSMDISTPRTCKISDEAAARIRAKVEAKLKEREEARRKIDIKPAKYREENKKPVRKNIARNRTRGRGNRKQITKEKI